MSEIEMLNHRCPLPLPVEYGRFECSCGRRWQVRPRLVITHDMLGTVVREEYKPDWFRRYLPG